MKLCDKILDLYADGEFIHQFYLDDTDDIQTIKRNIKGITYRLGAPIAIWRRDFIELNFEDEEPVRIRCKDFHSPTITKNFDIIFKSKDKDFGEITLQLKKTVEQDLKELISS